MSNMTSSWQATASKQVTTSVSYGGRVECMLVSQNQSTRKSVFRVRIGVAASGGFSSTMYWSGKLYYNNNVIVNFTHTSSNSPYTSGSGSGVKYIKLPGGSTTYDVTITHNAEGDAISGSFKLYLGYGYSKPSNYATTTYTETYTLPKIPVYSTFTISPSTNYIVGSTSMSFNITPGSSSWSHKIGISKTSSGTPTVIKTVSAGTTTGSVTIPSSLADQMTSTQQTMYVTCQAFSGSTGLGIKYISKVFVIPSNSEFLPTMDVELSAVDLSGNLLTYGYIANISHIKVLASNVSTKHSATVSSISSKISTGGNTYYLQSIGSNKYSVIYSDTVNISGTVTIVTTLKDSRGLVCTETNTISVLPYRTPNIISLTGYRSDSRGKTSSEGQYLHIDMYYTLSSILISGGTSNNLTLDGTETWLQESGTTSFYTSLDTLVKLEDYYGTIICNQLNVVKNNSLVTNNVGTISGYYDEESQYTGQNWIYINVGATTVSDLQTYLSNNPISITYYSVLPDEYNGYKYKLEYKRVSDISYIPIEDTTSTGTDTYRFRPMSVTRSLNLYVGDINHNYNVRLTVLDRLSGASGQAVESFIIRAAGNVFFNFNDTGTGMGIGKLSEMDGLDIGWKTRFDQGIVYAEIPANSDIGSIRTPGFYEGSTSNGNTGGPSSATGGFGLIVKSTYNNLVSQEFCSSSGGIYHRVYDGITWSSWESYVSANSSSSNLVDAIYPVGSVYISVISTSPSTLFPGTTWTRIGAGKFLIAAGDSGTYGGKGTDASATDKTGGTASVTMPAHRHLAPIGYNSTAVGGVNINGTTSSGNGKAYRTAKHDYTGTLDSSVTMYYTGNRVVNTSDGSLSIATVPPWIAAYMWYRTA